ncbi:DNase/tRNase domain of colicin-like bacteriocin [Gracilibacillus ureilyticus]|uniref:DNase/tRNase domain of colicin-like bacteriocin n=1 Tax=Gracilibacillus ureilyticus TaxID=531814 RepID=A0A1H9MKM1_9BACI|nr:HNH endonuclease [Gracilibacillus ureilyticus]SER24079.1 DNase/tRNase domain of colicin-like bacteriocin [Gracilibacillus ureilyticus]
MGVFRGIGKGIGTVGGGVIGGAAKLTGKAVGRKHKGAGKWLEDVGGSVEEASKAALENAGQFIDGASQSTYGMMRKDEYYKQKGIHDLKDSTGRTVKGISGAFHYTAQNVGTAYRGFISGNNKQVIEGLKNVGKVVAVSGLAIGVIDIIDSADVQAEEIETRNDHLNGTSHLETGVPFMEKTIELPNDEVVEGTFPVFDSVFTTVIAEDLYLDSDRVHFNLANETLYQAILTEPELASQLNLTQADMQGLANGETPEGFTWHHSEEPGKIQLVDEEIHQQTGHTGGREIWGGGSEFR